MKSLLKRYLPAIIILTILSFSILLASCQSNTPVPTQAINSPSNSQNNSSSPDGATLLEARCASCHSVEKVTSQKNTQAQWDKIVSRMIQKGAQLNDSEKTSLVNYLAQNYGK